MRFGQTYDQHVEKPAKPAPLSDLNGRHGAKVAKNELKVKDEIVVEARRAPSDEASLDSKCNRDMAKRFAELERREKAVSAKEEQLNLRELHLLRLEAKTSGTKSQERMAEWDTSGRQLPEKEVTTPNEGFRVQGIEGVPIPSKPDLADRGIASRDPPMPSATRQAETFAEDVERLQQARFDAAEAQRRVTLATEALADTQGVANSQGRLEYSQRLAEKRKELERWQRALEEKSKALEDLEKTLGDGKFLTVKGQNILSGPFFANLHTDAVNAASVAAKAMVGAGFTASKVVVALAKPVFGAAKIAGSAAVQFGVSTYSAAVARANEEAQERAMAQATALRRSKYYASMTPSHMTHHDFRDGSGVPPRRTWESPQMWGRTAWSPGWQPSPIYPASPAPHLPTVMEREGILGWIRRNSGCGTRNQTAYPTRCPTCG